jgi:hypothetical protein
MPIACEVRLAIGLRFLAGGLANDIVIIYGISYSQCYNSIWRVVDATNGCKHDDLKIEFPLRDAEKLQKLEAELSSRSRQQAWRGCVGCVDGAYFKMLNTGAAVDDSAKYMVPREDCFAHLCIAVCDADCRFLASDISHGPTTHDSLAFAATTVTHFFRS